jgi:hypothetical protein
MAIFLEDNDIDKVILVCTDYHGENWEDDYCINRRLEMVKCLSYDEYLSYTKEQIEGILRFNECRLEFVDLENWNDKEI